MLYPDKKFGYATNRPGYRSTQALPDRLDRTVRDTLNTLHDLRKRDVEVRTLADPIKVDSSSPNDSMAQLSVIILLLFGQMERTYVIERTMHARAVTEAKGKRVRKPNVVNPDKITYAAHMRNEGFSMNKKIVKKTYTVCSLPLPAAATRPVESHTADDDTKDQTPHHSKCG